MTLLSIEGLSTAYGAANILKNVSFTVGSNEIVTLIGANGAGKTTLLSAISGLVTKTSGTIRFENEDVTDLAPHKIVARGIVHVPEGRRIFPRLTVDENLVMGSFSRGRIEPSAINRVHELFPILKERRKQPGGTLSGGEQQMLAIGRALVAAPRLLLLDEPSLGLAPKLIERIFEAIREIHAAGTPILLVEQNARLALETASRGYVIESGEISLSGSGRDLLNNEQVMQAYLGL